MIHVRPAAPDDAHELMRLRTVMLSALSGTASVPGPWQATGVRILREQLGTTLTAFVVDDPDVDGRLAACVVGAVDQRLPGPRNPTGRVGYVFNVATDPRCRRRGYSRACLQALLRCYDEQGIVTVDLRASADGEPLYTALGFQRTADPSMRRASVTADDDAGTA